MVSDAEDPESVPIRPAATVIPLRDGDAGLEVLVLTFTREFLVAGLVGIPMVLGVRFASVGLMVTLLRVRRSFSSSAPCRTP